ncbi:AAA family ATPase [Staphylococcus equorum]|uniref:AAA family ATPase n=4 Tax=Staphylococcus equorum TaxID=246432 RepID=UPI0020A15523|nr:AAA family ATPase [Staphylococcus equorum]
MNRIYNSVIKYMETGIPFIFLEGFENGPDKLVEYIEDKNLKENIYFYNLTTSKTLNGRVENNLQTYNDIGNQIKDAENGNNLVIIEGSQGLLDYENGEILENIAVKVNKYSKKNLTIIFIGNNYNIPENIKKYSILIENELPDEEEIKGIIFEFLKFQIPELNYNNYNYDHLTKQLKGLNELEINQILAILYYEYGINIFTTQTSEYYNYITQEIKDIKIQILKKTGTLNIVNSNASLDKDIGGLNRLMEYIKNIDGVLKNSNELIERNVTLPKGILLIGKPGNGKSLTARATASTLNLPLISFDISKILGKYVGESEKQMKKSLQIVQAMSPCVLWIDEIEKAFAGINNSENDTMRKILGIFLTWMSDENQGVYVIATANAIDGNIPPEMVRKGRFDDIFYIDNPNISDRKNIFEVHLNKRNITLNNDEYLYDLARKSKHFSGSEIEYCCNSAATSLIVENYSGIIDDKTIRNKVNGFIKETLENKNSLEYETNIEDAMKNIKNNNKEIYSFLKKYNESADEISTLFKEKISYVLGKEIEKYINFNKIDNENKNKFKSASQ